MIDSYDSTSTSTAGTAVYEQIVTAERQLTLLSTGLAGVELVDLFVGKSIVLDHLLAHYGQNLNDRLDRVGHTVVWPRHQMELSELVLGEQWLSATATAIATYMMTGMMITINIMIVAMMLTIMMTVDEAQTGR